MRHVRVVINGIESSILNIQKAVLIFGAIDVIKLVRPHINVNVYTDCHPVLARQINWKLEK
jgi:hypothetical protein